MAESMQEFMALCMGIEAADLLVVEALGPHLYRSDACRDDDCAGCDDPECADWCHQGWAGT